MVEVLIEEMYGSDWNRPLGYERAVVVDAEITENEQDHSSKWMEKCAQKWFDRADIVRDVRYRLVRTDLAEAANPLSRLRLKCNPADSTVL